MDKNTLSNYGWIVIAVLVLAVMIALATPFGKYVESGVKSTTTGLFETSEKALNVVGMSAGNGNFEDGGNNSVTRDPALNHSGTIPEGGKYYRNVSICDNCGMFIGVEEPFYHCQSCDGYGFDEECPNCLPEDANVHLACYCLDYISQYEQPQMLNEFPDEPQIADIYVYGDYIYYYKQTTKNIIDDGTEGEEIMEGYFEQTIDGWGVKLKGGSYSYKSQYGDILESINGKDVTSIRNLFSGDGALTTTPKLPNTITDMDSAFMYCQNLTTVQNIPNNVTDMSHAFYSCSSLTTVPKIPNKVIDMYGTFSSCSSLTVAPEIPNSVTNMRNTFSNCTSLTKAPIIPNAIKVMDYTFDSCYSLTGTITINANPTDYYGCFDAVDFGTQNITLTGTSTMLTDIGATSKNYCLDCCGPCQHTHGIKDIPAGATFVKQLKSIGCHNYWSEHNDECFKNCEETFLTWEELQLEENAEKHGYGTGFIGDTYLNHGIDAQMCGMTYMVLPENLERIEDLTFYSLPTEGMTFLGTLNQWNQMSRVGDWYYYENGNGPNGDYNIVCWNGTITY